MARLTIDDIPHKDDLSGGAPVKHKLTGFLNIGKDGEIFYTPEKWSDFDYAQNFIMSERIACLDLSKYGIEFETGEGIKDMMQELVDATKELGIDGY